MVKLNIKEGDCLYSLDYEYQHYPKSITKRIIRKRKIHKVDTRYNCVRFSNKESVAISAINNFDVNEWYTSKKKMYEGTLKKTLEEYKNIFSEVNYLKKKLKPKVGKGKW